MRPTALAICAALILATPALAASRPDFNAAYAAAEKVEHQALALQDAWTTTEKTLKAAKKAAAAKDYDRATALAHKAQALAKVSVRQAREQAKIWRQAVVH